VLIAKGWNSAFSSHVVCIENVTFDAMLGHFNQKDCKITTFDLADDKASNVG
jgi:hypothetical protein